MKQEFHEEVISRAVVFHNKHTVRSFKHKYRIQSSTIRSWQYFHNF